mgnify:FL=1
MNNFIGIWVRLATQIVETKKKLLSTPQLDNRFGKRTADRVTLNGSDLALRRYHIPYPQDKNR